MKILIIFVFFMGYVIGLSASVFAYLSEVGIFFLAGFPIALIGVMTFQFLFNKKEDHEN